MQDIKLRSRLKAQLTKFSSELCGGLSKPLAKFVGQMLFGIQASQDVKLSNISRSLKEEIPLIKTEDRLSRNLKVVELEAELTSQLAKRASRRVGANTVLCLDLSDVRKEYVKKMEYLAPVRTVHEPLTRCPFRCTLPGRSNSERLEVFNARSLPLLRGVPIFIIRGDLRKHHKQFHPRRAEIVFDQSGNRLSSVFDNVKPSALGKALAAWHPTTTRISACEAARRRNAPKPSGLSESLRAWISPPTVHAQFGCGTCVGHYIQQGPGQKCGQCTPSTCNDEGYSYEVGCDCIYFNCNGVPCVAYIQCSNP